MKYMTFWGWLFLLSVMLLRAIQVVKCIDGFLIFLTSMPWYGCTTFCLTVYSLKDTQVLSSLGLQVRLLWTFIYRILHEGRFSFLWDKCPKSTLAGSAHKLIFSFNRHCQTSFQRLCHFTFMPARMNTVVNFWGQVDWTVVSVVWPNVSLDVAVKVFFGCG